MGDAPRLTALLEEHRLVVFRDVQTNPGFQLRISGGLGCLVAKPQPGSRQFLVLPQLRLESNKPASATNVRQVDMYSAYWHSDLSWAEKPADYTLLLALGVEGPTESTVFADTRAGYARLSERCRNLIASWMAYHHVQRSRELRYGFRKTGATAQPVKRHRWRLKDRWLAWRYDVAIPQRADPHGSLHSVVQFDQLSGSPYVYLGDHAWALKGFDKTDGLAEIDELNRRITDHDYVYEHCWRFRDLLIFDNRTLLHRRKSVPDLTGSRILRKTLVWRR